VHVSLIAQKDNTVLCGSVIVDVIGTALNAVFDMNNGNFIIKSDGWQCSTAQ
jgi:hypothetical protein